MWICVFIAEKHVPTHAPCLPGRLCCAGSADAKTAHGPGRRFGAEFCLVREWLLGDWGSPGGLLLLRLAYAEGAVEKGYVP